MLLTIAEVAEQLRVDVSTVYRWTTAGTLDAVRFAGSVRVPADELSRFIQAPTTEGETRNE